MAQPRPRPGTKEWAQKHAIRIERVREVQRRYDELGDQLAREWIRSMSVLDPRLPATGEAFLLCSNWGNDAARRAMAAARRADRRLRSRRHRELDRAWVSEVSSQDSSC